MAEAAKPEKTKEEKELEKAEKEKEDEEKEKKAEAKATSKFMDEADENFCGFMNLIIVDSDGYAKKTKGMDIKGPLYMTSDGATGDPVVLETEFALNPLFFIQVPNDDNLLMFGQWWVGENKSTLTTIGSAIPKFTKVALTDMEKSGTSEFSLDVEMPLLKGAPSRLVKATISTKEQKFVTKVVKTKIEIPRASWKEWKQHRNKFRNFGKNQGGGGAGGGGGGGGEKKEEKKEE
eukprot:gnl/TRDRNA2_/TRDRNA2_171250_c0_seq8.p1 gnl/TRDRNA2_/TRDRNA2_171250_c0~~gnl/TRDRNA2_/TRDRNA2_171250_c0_seq8.p1  ORF type:complete len:234 (+),score=82.89 gnl/TRDRNA2_/TRDRNA2_171250_c0_seq8:84-785(+)